MALYPIYKEFGLQKTIVSTYQAASGAGYSAMQELRDETRNFLDNKEVKIINSLIPYHSI
ncbi:MAG: Asd/ArgC dimerization domain-containing protein [Saprospiraceae bacterium]